MISGTLIAVLGTWSPTAAACSIAVPGDPYTDDGAGDTAAPEFDPGDITVSVTRGVGPVCDAWGTCMQSSCDDLGFVNLSFGAAIDDRTTDVPSSDDWATQENVGYRLRLVDGTLADGLVLSEDPVGVWVSDTTASTALVWIDDALDAQEAFDATIGITAVDAAGNESVEVEFALSDPGRAATGCQVAPAAGGLVWVLGVLGTRRRR